MKSGHVIVSLSCENADTCKKKINCNECFIHEAKNGFTNLRFGQWYVVSAGIQEKKKNRQKTDGNLLDHDQWVRNEEESQEERERMGLPRYY